MTNKKSIKRLHSGKGNVSLFLKTKKASETLKEIAKVVTPVIESFLSLSVRPMVTSSKNVPGKCQLLFAIKNHEGLSEGLSKKGFDFFQCKEKDEIRIWSIPTQIISEKMNTLLKDSGEKYSTARLNSCGDIDFNFSFDNDSDALAMKEIAKEQGFKVRAKHKARVGKPKPGFIITQKLASFERLSNVKKKVLKQAPKKKSSDAFNVDFLKVHIESGLKMLPKSVVLEMLMEYLPEGVGLYNAKDPFKTNGVVSINKVNVKDLV